MQPQSFLERLDAAGRNEVPRELVLKPFLEGLEQLLVDFEASLEHQPVEMVEMLDGYLAEIAETVQACQDLAEECLEQDCSPEAFLDLADSHQYLNRLLLDFHRESWIYRGPTPVDWINMILDARDRFMAGEELSSGLSFLLHDHNKDLELKLASKPALEGEALLTVLRRLREWADASTTFNRSQLDDLFGKLEQYGEKFAPYLSEQKVCLEQLILSLDQELSSEELDFVVGQAIEEIDDLQDRMIPCLTELTGLRKDYLSEILECLSELGARLLALQADSVTDDQIHELMGLYDSLERALTQFREANLNEGTVPCPKCGERNSRQTRRCGRCSTVLAAEVGEGAKLDISDDGGGQVEEEHVYRFRAVCRGFQEKALTLEQFHQHLAAVKKRLGESVKQAGGSESLPGDGAFSEGIDLIARGLAVLEPVELPEDLAVEQGLAFYLQGVECLRQSGAGP